MKASNTILRLRTALAAAALLLSVGVSAQTVKTPRGSDKFNIGIAGFSYRNYNIDQTLVFLRSMDIKYLSIKDFLLPLNSTVEQMEAVKAKCAAAGVDGYILGPIYMNTKEQVDRTFEYVARYGHDMFIGVPAYELLDYVIEKVKETGIRVAIHTHGPDGAAFPDIRTVVDIDNVEVPILDGRI